MAEEKAETPEEGVDWNAANDFFNGKPQEVEGEGTEKPADETPAGEKDDTKLVEVSIRGRKVLVTEEAAQAHRDYMREVRERDGRLGGEIAQLRERSAKLEGALEAIRQPRSIDRPIPPPAKLAVEDFEEYHRQMLAYNQAEMARQQVELVTRYEQDVTERTTQTASQRTATVWANKFYEKNPDLNHPRLRTIVHEVYQEHRSDIDALNAVDGHDLLAELVNEEVVQLRSAGKNQDTNPKRPPHLEGTARMASHKVAEDRHVPVTAASWVRRERARLRGEKVA